MLEPCILDLIFHNSVNDNLDLIENFWENFHVFLIKSLNNVDFKYKFVDYILKNSTKKYNVIKEVKSEISKDFDVMKTIINSRNFFMFPQIFNIRIFNEEKQPILYNTRKVMKRFCKQLDFFQFVIFDDAETSKIFFTSGKWGIIVRALGIIEGIVNSNFDILEDSDYLIYPRIKSTMDNFIFHHMLGLLKLKNAAEKEKILSEMEESLLGQLREIESMTDSFAKNGSETQKYGPFRLGIVQRYLGFVLFVKYFIGVRNNLLHLNSNLISKEQRTKYAKNTCLDFEQRKSFYRRVVRNYIFYLLRCTDIKKKYIAQIHVDQNTQTNDLNILFFKCLFYLDDAFREIITEEVQNGFEKIIELNEIGNCQKYMGALFHFYLELVYNENILENNYLILAIEYKTHDSSIPLDSRLENIMSNAPTFEQRIKIVVQSMPNILIKEVFNLINLPFVFCKSRLIEFIDSILESNFNFNKKTKKFVIKNENRKIPFYQNLFLYDIHPKNEIIRNLKDKESKYEQINLFSWKNQRSEFALNYLEKKQILEWLVKYYFIFSDHCSNEKENQRKGLTDNTEIDLIAESILICSKIIDKKSVFKSFFFKNYKQMGKRMKKLVQNQATILKLKIFDTIRDSEQNEETNKKKSNLKKKKSQKFNEQNPEKNQKTKANKNI